MVSSIVRKQSLPLSNDEVADRLHEIAELLEAQDANPFRVRAYRIAAVTVEGLSESLHEILARDGKLGMTHFPGIGHSLSRSIDQLVHSGRLGLLDRLRGDTGVERVFSTVPGIGHEMATRIHDKLAIETLFELEAAAHDGRLAQVPGMGAKRIRAVRESLAGRFRRQSATPAVSYPKPNDEPPISELLDIDCEYHEKAGANKLATIAPRRFNPTGAAWLPILHTKRGNRHYTALYSNTARAHEMGTVRDWVVIYRDDHHGDGQWTVVTARFGKLQGQRIVRGRESECSEHYLHMPTYPTDLSN